MKQIFLPILLLILFCLTSCFTNPEKHKKIMETYLEGYKLLNIREGNFTPAEGKEYLAFYSEIREIAGVDRDDIDQLIYFVFKNNKIDKVIELSKTKIWSGAYDDFSLKIINNSNYNNTNWDGYCFVNDFNQNGIDEFVFFGLSGMGFIVDIIEYNSIENNFALVLNEPYIKTEGYSIDIAISEITTKIENGKRYVILYGYQREGMPEHHREYYKCEWSESKGEFVVVEEGHEYWDF